jgi:GPH family glycoside/pentoside/hexuronide:cation symporter
MSIIAWRERLAYSGGDLGFNLLFGSIGAFLLYFYTDVFGISATQAGIVLLVARIWDAVWDLVLGALVDRTRTRFGQMRPYLFLGAPLLGLAAVACFSVPALEGTAKLAYAFVSYTLLMTAYSLVNIPYGALPTLMSPDSQQRTRLASWRMAFAFTGTLLMGALTQPLLGVFGGGNAALGFQRVMTLYGTLLVLLLWICAAICRERVAPLPQPASGDVWRDAAVVLRDRAWWSLAGANLLVFSFLLLPLTNAVYYMTHVVGQPQMIPAYMIASGVGMIVAALLSGALTQRWCKRSVWRASTVLGAAVLAAVYFIDQHSLVQVIGMAFLSTATVGIAAPINFAMASDVSDRIELTAGRRMTGLVFSGIAFSGKAGLGLGGALAGLLLGWFGYVANTTLEPRAVQGILICMSLVPAAGCLVLLGVQWLYPLHRELVEDVSRQLRERRALAA